MNPFWSLLKNLMFLSRRSLVFFSSCLLVVLYSQDLIAKKRAPDSSWPIAVLRGFDLSAAIVFHTTRGRQAWCFVGGSSDLYPFNWLDRITDLVPELSRVGSALRFFLKA